MSTNMLYRAAVDNEFREELMHRPEAFGASDGLSVPTSVAQPDAATVDFWTEAVASTEVYACATSCSFGPFTIVCDGTTK